MTFVGRARSRFGAEIVRVVVNGPYRSKHTCNEREDYLDELVIALCKYRFSSEMFIALPAVAASV